MFYKTEDFLQMKKNTDRQTWNDFTLRQNERQTDAKTVKDRNDRKKGYEKGKQPDRKTDTQTEIKSVRKDSNN